MSGQENEFVDWLRQVIKPSPAATLSIGDDAALLQPLQAGTRGILVATDMLLEGIHFDLSNTSAESIGRKAVAVNLSDIAAMGGTPTSVFISLGIPQTMPMEQLQSLMLGAQDVCAEFGCGIDGGDTNSWTQGLVINVSVMGTPHPRGVVTRSGARTGDVVMVSGQTLGGSLRSGRHLTFTPRVREAQWLMDHYTIHSMMDLSDGLAADGARMAQSSATKFIFDKDAVSLDPSALYQSFCDGEDFELLFTCDPLTASHIETHAAWPCGFRRIGRVESGAGIFLEAAGQREPLPDQWQGWTHPLAVK